VTPARKSSDKQGLRAQLLAARRALGPEERMRAAEQLTRNLLALPELAGSRTLAAYLSFGTEPVTTAVLAELSSRKTTVLVPVVLPDLDLDWAIYDETTRPPVDAPALWVPPGARQGVQAVGSADAVVVPALAVGASGTRLGRGGGSYDRALTRVRAGVPVIALLYDGELLDDVPAEPHDRAVTMAVQPSGVTRFDAVAA
jgi:5-formyltetrahydrofolate cyclo-ligase